MQKTPPTLRHFRLRTDAKGILHVTLDCADNTVNRLSDAVLKEFARVLDFSLHLLPAAPFPTLALLHGHCLGGGLELAMACRYRLAVDQANTQPGLPEVLLGIFPAWGGMQRLPRLVGATTALDMMLTGQSVDAHKAWRIGLVDGVVPPRQARLAYDCLIPDPVGHGLRRADVVLETTTANLHAKRALYQEIVPHLQPHALLATHTPNLLLEYLEADPTLDPANTGTIPGRRRGRRRSGRRGRYFWHRVCPVYGGGPLQLNNDRLSHEI